MTTQLVDSNRRLVTGRAQRGLALLVVLLLPIRAFAPLGSVSLDAGVLLGILLLPVLLKALFSSGRLWLATAALMLAALVLFPVVSFLSLAADPLRAIDATLQRGTVLQLVAGLIMLLVFAWAAKHVRISSLLVTYAVGAILNMVLGGTPPSDNPWKVGLAWAITVLLLAVASRLPKTQLAILILIGLTVVSLALDSRSVALFTAVTAVAAGYAAIVRRSTITRLRVLFTAIGLTLVVLATFVLGSLLATSGVLGTAVQSRTQFQSAVSLIQAARPESTATFALFFAQPLGYGAGLIPSPADLSVATTALYDFDPNLANSSYINGYLLGNHIEVHSVAGDLWLSFGLPGLALAVLFFVLISRGMSLAFMQRRATPLVLFLGFSGIWDILFSPLYSNLGMVLLSVCVMLAVHRSDEYRSSPLGDGVVSR